MPYNFVADSFHTNFLAEFLESKCDFKPYAAVFAFWNPPLGRLGTTYEYYLGLIGKRVVVSGLPISVN